MWLLISENIGSNLLRRSTSQRGETRASQGKRLSPDAKRLGLLQERENRSKIVGG